MAWKKKNLKGEVEELNSKELNDILGHVTP